MNRVDRVTESLVLGFCDLKCGVFIGITLLKLYFTWQTSLPKQKLFFLSPAESCTIILFCLY